jgi:hypothetical protein
VTDVPLLILVSAVAAVAFRRRGDRLWVAVGKGLLVGIVAVTLLGVVLAVTVGGR